MASYLVTGTSRGIGLAMVKELLLRPASEVSKIIAAARSESESLRDVISTSNGRVEFVPLEVLDQDQIQKAVTLASGILGEKGLDVLINNAGVRDQPGSIRDMTELKHIFDVNVVGVHNITNAFVPLLEKGNLKKVINISTPVGSITHSATYRHSPFPAYKISKAALNMLTVQWHYEKYEQGFTVFALQPGWVKTDLGGEIADLEVGEAVTALVKRGLEAGRPESGKFLNILVEGWENSKPGKWNWYDGKEIAW